MANTLHRHAFWKVLNVDQHPHRPSLFMVHTHEGVFPTLFSEAHVLMEEMCGPHTVRLRDRQDDKLVQNAVSQSPFPIQSESSYFTVAVCNEHTGIGIGSNTKVRTKAAKLALALGMAAETHGKFTFSRESGLANQIAETARTMLHLMPSLKFAGSGAASPLACAGFTVNSGTTTVRPLPIPLPPGSATYERPSSSPSPPTSESMQNDSSSASEQVNYDRAGEQPLPSSSPLAQCSQSGPAPTSQQVSSGFVPVSSIALEGLHGLEETALPQKHTSSPRFTNSRSSAPADVMLSPTCKTNTSSSSSRSCFQSLSTESDCLASTVSEGHNNKESQLPGAPAGILESSDTKSSSVRSLSSAHPNSAAPSRGDPRLFSGYEVQVHGIQSATHLNGQLGRITQSEQGSGKSKNRWGVHLKSGKHVSIRTQNLKPAPVIAWCPSAFEVVSGLDIDQSIIFTERSGVDGPYVAFGDIVCSERYILWQAQICNRSLRRAPVNLHKIGEFPHMTLAKLEGGYHERRANESIWFVDGADGLEEFNLSPVLCEINESLRMDSTLYRIHSGHLSPNYYCCRYDITGGDARGVFRRVQDMLRLKLTRFGDHVGFWAEEPAHPHITYEYPEEQLDEALSVDDGCSKDERLTVGSSPTSSSKCSSLDIVLDMLKDRHLERYRSIFEKERITQSVLASGSLSESHMKEMGVKIGDRVRLLQLGAELKSKNAASSQDTFQ